MHWPVDAKEVVPQGIFGHQFVNKVMERGESAPTATRMWRTAAVRIQRLFIMLPPQTCSNVASNLTRCCTETI